MCGRNEELKENLKLTIASSDLENTALKRCLVLGFLEAQDKNELMNICSLMIGKPGGSTVGEVSKLRLPMFIMHIQKICELGNLEKLLEDRLAYEYNPHELLTEQIEKTLKAVEIAEPYSNFEPWEKLILQKLLSLGHVF